MLQIVFMTYMLTKSAKASLLLFTAVFFWAGNLVCGRYLHTSIPPFGIGFWRWAIPLVLLTLINWKNSFSFFRMLKRHFYQLFLLSLFGVVLSSTLQYVGLDYASATDAGIIITLMPIFIALCAEIILHEKTTLVQKLGMLIALLGAVILITRGRLVDILHFNFNLGDVILVFAAFSWGIYTALLKKFKLPCTPWELIQGTSWVSTIFIAVILVLQGPIAINATFMHLQTSSLLALLYMGIGASLISFWAWNRGVELIGASEAGVFLYFMPVISAALAYVFLGEQLHIYHFVGAAIILFGVFLNVRK